MASAKSISDILNKGLARLAKIDAQKAAAISGKPIRIAGAVKSLQQIQKSAEKARERYVASILEGRNDVIYKDIPLAAIRDGQKIAEKAISQQQNILENGWKRTVLLNFELTVEQIKANIADSDVINVANANEALQDFMDGLNEYTKDTIAKGQEIQRDAIMRLWQTCISDEYVKILTRTSTPFDAIDVFKYDALRAINAAKTADEANLAIEKFEKEVNIWLEKNCILEETE